MRLLLLAIVLLSACAQPVTAPRPSAEPLSREFLNPSPESSQPRTEAPSVSLPGTAAPQPTAYTVAPAHATNPKPPKDGVTGTATWFDAPYGTAAAGPALRDYLGTDWRGKRVSVTAPGCGCPAVVVLLNDWCFCGSGRVIDLNRAAFANLAMPSKGVIKVVVREVP